MRRNAGTIVFSLAVGYALAHFLVAFYNHWYFAGWFWLKVGLLTPLVAVAFGCVLLTGWRRLWQLCGAWWIITHLLAMVPAGGPDLRNLAFVAVLDFEVAVVWGPGFVIAAWGLYHSWLKHRSVTAESRAVEAQLKMRRRLRERLARQELRKPLVQQPIPVSVPVENDHDA